MLELPPLRHDVTPSNSTRPTKAERRGTAAKVAAGCPQELFRGGTKNAVHKSILGAFAFLSTDMKLFVLCYSGTLRPNAKGHNFCRPTRFIVNSMQNNEREESKTADVLLNGKCSSQRKTA